MCLNAIYLSFILGLLCTLLNFYSCFAQKFKFEIALDCSNLTVSVECGNMPSGLNVETCFANIFSVLFNFLYAFHVYVVTTDSLHSVSITLNYELSQLFLRITFFENKIILFLLGCDPSQKNVFCLNTFTWSKFHKTFLSINYGFL